MNQTAGIGITPRRREDVRFLIDARQYLDHIIFPAIANGIAEAVGGKAGAIAALNGPSTPCHIWQALSVA
jgi:hypothetical protein